jgi:hypothetical protein
MNQKLNLAVDPSIEGIKQYEMLIMRYFEFMNLIRQRHQKMEKN